MKKILVKIQVKRLVVTLYSTEKKDEGFYTVADDRNGDDEFTSLEDAIAEFCQRIGITRPESIDTFTRLAR